MNAVLSPDGEYRYALWRALQRQLVPRVDETGDSVLFVMLNPSTADDVEDDPTIRRCLGFARREGFARLAVGNLYALRSTKPTALASHVDPVGPLNDEWIARLAVESSLIVAAWGASRHAAPARVRWVTRLLEASGRPVKCLDVTDGGQPRHPLYVPGDQELADFRVAA